MKLTTTNLKLPSPRAWCDLSTPVCAALCLFLLLLMGLVVGRIHTAPQAFARPTPALPSPIIIIATSPAVVPPTAVPAAQVAAVPPNALRRAVVAYDAPAGNALGAIEQGRGYHVLARFGSDWLQADVQGSGVVWLKADQVLDLPEGLADLKPTDAPVIVERPVYVASQPISVEQAAPTPAPYTVANEPPPAPQQAAILDRGQWAVMAATAKAGR